jgi:hypothetical protein
VSITITKHRESADFYAADFSAQMREDEELTAPEVRFASRRVEGARWKDHTAELLDAESVLIEGAEVRFRLRAAGEGEQRAGEYVVFARADTDTGRTLYVTGGLSIDATASNP